MESVKFDRLSKRISLNFRFLTTGRHSTHSTGQTKQLKNLKKIKDILKSLLYNPCKLQLDRLNLSYLTGVQKMSVLITGRWDIQRPLSVKLSFREIRKKPRTLYNDSNIICVNFKLIGWISQIWQVVKMSSFKF